MYPVRAKKYLGQHFLNDENIAKKIAYSISDRTTSLLEIGPGTGVLTKYLIEKNIPHFTAIEIDTESVRYLQEHYNLGEKLINGDFLKIDISNIFTGKFSVIGNFPYNISSQIFFKILEYHNNIEECIGMVQKEVALRIASSPGNKDYGILSVLLQAWFYVEYLFSVSSNVFVPPPKVQSAVIRLKRNEMEKLSCDEKLFKLVVKTSFNQRRKTLHNALKPIADYSGEFAAKRAEQLSVNDFEKLTLEIIKIK
jgi:16S rRNA (adenine1518-N6/adenine1519-N6)-dimethyltransferase